MDKIHSIFTPQFDALLAKLEEIAAEAGIDLSFTQDTLKRNSQRTTGRFAMKVMEDEAGNQIDPDYDRFVDQARLMNIPAKWYGQTFKFPQNGKVYRISGLRPSARKNKIELIDVATGGLCTTSIATVKLYVPA